MTKQDWKKKRWIMAISMMVLIVNLFAPISQAAALKKDFNFTLYYQTDDDNTQVDAFRFSDFIVDDYARVFFLTQANATDNMKFKILNKNERGGIRGEASGRYVCKGVGSQSVYYTSDYSYVSGYYAMYFWSTVRDCSASGTWVP